VTRTKKRKKLKNHAENSNGGRKRENISSTQRKNHNQAKKEAHVFKLWSVISQAKIVSCVFVIIKAEQKSSSMTKRNHNNNNIAKKERRR
jgi:hypothetical protein